RSTHVPATGPPGLSARPARRARHPPARLALSRRVDEARIERAKRHFLATRAQPRQQPVRALLQQAARGHMQAMRRMLLFVSAPLLVWICWTAYVPMPDPIDTSIEHGQRGEHARPGARLR